MQFKTLEDYVGHTPLVRLKRINAGQCKLAAAEFDRWVFAKGKKLRGLVRRRAYERRLFETDCALWKAPHDLSNFVSRTAQVAP